MTVDRDYRAVDERARSSRSGTSRRVRNDLVMVRLSADEKARFAALAARHGLSLPNLMRLAVEAALVEEAVRG